MKPTKLTPAQLKMKAALKPIVEGILKEESTAGYMNKITDLLEKAASLAIELNTFAEDDYWKYRGNRDKNILLKNLASVLSAFGAGSETDLSYAREYIKFS